MKQFLPKLLVFSCSLGLITGCHQKKPIAQQPPLQAQAPAVPATHPVPMEVIPLEPEKTSTAAATPPAPAITPPPPPARPEKHRKSKVQPPPTPVSAPATATSTPTPTPTPTPPPAPAAQTPPASPATTTAANPARLANSSASPIGQLTEGDISGSAQVQEETEKLIRGTESGVAGLQRALTAPEQETVKQIKKFIEQAREALAAQDAGGAHTLAFKASLLLAELKK